MKYIITALILLNLPAFALAEDGETEEREWKRIKNKDGIEVFRSHTDTSRLKTFKVITTMELENIQTYAALLMDESSYPDWGHMINKAEIQELEKQSLYSVYITTLLPWPVKDRHVKYDMSFTQKDDYSLEYVITESNPLPPKRKGYILSPEVHGKILLNAKEGSKEVEIVTQILIDPGGYVPAFLVNLITGDVGYFTAKKVKRYLLEGDLDIEKLDVAFVKRRPWIQETSN